MALSDEAEFWGRFPPDKAPRRTPEKLKAESDRKKERVAISKKYKKAHPEMSWRQIKKLAQSIGWNNLLTPPQSLPQ